MIDEILLVYGLVLKARCLVIDCPLSLVNLDKLRFVGL